VRGKMLLFVLGLAALVYVLVRFVFRVVGNALLAPSGQRSAESAIALYTVTVWVILAAVFLLATALLARSLGLRGWRATATSMSASALSLLVLLALSWGLSFAPFSLQAWSFSESGIVATALLLSVGAVGFTRLLGIGFGRAGTRRTSAST